MVEPVEPQRHRGHREENTEKICKNEERTMKNEE
jgi:hypothetical protein